MTSDKTAALHDALLRLGPDYDDADWARYDVIPEVKSASDALILSMIRPYDAPEVNLDDPEAWVSIHAWRIAARRRLPALIEPMLRVVDHPDDNQASSQFPKVCGIVGPVAIDGLGSILSDRQRSDMQRILAAQGLEAIARQSGPTDRHRSIARLTRQVENGDTDDRAVSGEAARMLIALNAVSVRQIVLAAYQAGRLTLGLPGEHELKRVFGDPE